MWKLGEESIKFLRNSESQRADAVVVPVAEIDFEPVPDGCHGDAAGFVKLGIYGRLILAVISS